MCSIGCRLMQLEISKTGISMVSGSSDSVSTSPMSSAAHPRPPLVSSVTALVDYKESVVRDSLDHMEKEQIEKSSHMGKEQIEKSSHMEKEQDEELSPLEKEQIETLNKYKVEARQYLMSKYFSDKTIFGGNIFEVKVTKDGESSKVSSFPGYQSYADPANFKDDSQLTTGTPSDVPKVKGKRSSRKK